jgi:hypothetical protein
MEIGKGTVGAPTTPSHTGANSTGKSDGSKGIWSSNQGLTVEIDHMTDPLDMIAQHRSEEEQLEETLLEENDQAPEELEVAESEAPEVEPEEHHSEAEEEEGEKEKEEGRKRGRDQREEQEESGKGENNKTKKKSQDSEKDDAERQARQRAHRDNPLPDENLDKHNDAHNSEPEAKPSTSIFRCFFG